MLLSGLTTVVQLANRPEEDSDLTESFRAYLWILHLTGVCFPPFQKPAINGLPPTPKVLVSRPQPGGLPLQLLLLDPSPLLLDHFPLQLLLLDPFLLLLDHFPLLLDHFPLQLLLLDPFPLLLDPFPLLLDPFPLLLDHFPLQLLLLLLDRFPPNTPH